MAKTKTGQPKIDSETGQEIILAQDAKEGESYLSAMMRYKIVVKKIRRAEDGFVGSVLVESESSRQPIDIAGGTELIRFKKELYKPFVQPKYFKEDAVSKVEKPPKTKAPAGEPKVKMSDIITPMLLEGTHTAEEIADAVIKKVPEKKDERDKLVLQIKGPRLYNLTKDAREAKTKLPALKESKDAKKAVPEKKPEKAVEPAAKKEEPSIKKPAAKKAAVKKPAEPKSAEPEAPAESATKS